MFKFLKKNKVEKGEEYYHVILRDPFGGNNDEFVKAGCAEDAVDKAKENLSEHIDAKELEFVSVERGIINWER